MVLKEGGWRALWKRILEWLGSFVLGLFHINKEHQMPQRDEITNRLRAVLERVRNEKDVNTGLRQMTEAQQQEISTLREQLEAGQQQPGPWTPDDIQAIIDQLTQIEQVWTPDEVASAVTENTPVADAGARGGGGEAG